VRWCLSRGRPSAGAAADVRFIGPPEDVRNSPVWGLLVVVVLAGLWLIFVGQAVVHDATADRQWFTNDESVARRREDSIRCVARRMDDLVQRLTSSPLTRGADWRLPPSPTPTLLDCEDAKRE